MSFRRPVSPSDLVGKRAKTDRGSSFSGNWYKIILIALFLATIFTPLTANFLPILPKNNILMENRNPRPLPQLATPIFSRATVDFPSQCLEYFGVIDEEFNGRTFLLSKHFAIRRFLFGVKKPIQIVDGSETDASQKQTNDYRKKIERFHHFFAERNIPYFLAVTPDKNYYYRHSLRSISFGLRPLASSLKERESPVDFFFMDDVLIKCREQESLPPFFVGDHHWNHVGGYRGYVAFMERIRRFLPDVPILEPGKDFTYETIRTSRSLAGFQTEGKTSAKYFEDDYVPVFSGNNNVSITPNIEAPTYEIDSRMVGLIESVNPDRKYTILILRDSYGIGMMPFFDHTFGKCVYSLVHWYTHKAKTMDQKMLEIAELVDLHKPDVVIQLTDPRHFYMAFP